VKDEFDAVIVTDVTGAEASFARSVRSVADLVAGAAHVTECSRLYHPIHAHYQVIKL
jgi:hypothetical protein